MVYMPYYTLPGTPARYTAGYRTWPAGCAERGTGASSGCCI